MAESSTISTRTGDLRSRFMRSCGKFRLRPNVQRVSRSRTELGDAGQQPAASFGHIVERFQRPTLMRRDRSSRGRCGRRRRRSADGTEKAAPSSSGGGRCTSAGWARTTLNSSVADRIEIALQVVFRRVLEMRPAVDGGFGLLDDRGADIGAENGDATCRLLGPQGLRGQHRQRIGFVTGRRRGAPDVQLGLVRQRGRMVLAK